MVTKKSRLAVGALAVSLLTGCAQFMESIALSPEEAAFTSISGARPAEKRPSVSGVLKSAAQPTAGMSCD